MAGIPPALRTDSEDVAWALQTADALWKRNEQVDAIVWLRRAAQAAAEIDDDDRALALARNAADLTAWAAERRTASRGPDASPPPEMIDEDDVEELLPRDVSDSVEEVTLPEIPVEPEFDPAVEPAVEPPRGALASALRKLASAKEAAQRARAVEAVQRGRAGEAPSGTASPHRPMPAAKPPSVSRVPVSSAAVFVASSSRPPGSLAAAASPRSLPPGSRPPPSLRRSPPPLPPPLDLPSVEVPTAAEVHAGMLDPWAEGERPGQAAPHASIARPEAARAFDADEVVTSAPPVVRVSPGADVVLSSPRSAASSSRIRAAAASLRELAPIDLSGAEALSDLPDDARDAFARGAAIRNLARGEEVSRFALAMVVAGSADLSSAVVDAPVMRLGARQVVRGRGTLVRFAPLRLVAAAEGARIAIWEEQDVAAAFRSCSWVEDELRAAGDRVQALVGITMGRLGDRLDAALRAQVTGRLALRVLAEDEIVAKAGQPVPGILVVGAGQLELVNADGIADGRVLQPGDFLFPSEMLRAAVAPRDVRAAKDGALVLVADRTIAQELLVTCPPLLEIFAEG